MGKQVPGALLAAAIAMLSLAAPAASAAPGRLAVGRHARRTAGSSSICGSCAPTGRTCAG
jgi:hypothetical protein